MLSDDFDEMHEQACKIASWGDNVYVRDSDLQYEGPERDSLIRRLASKGIKLNVTAIFTRKQIEETVTALTGAAPSCVSVFAGRIADAGEDPVPYIRYALEVMKDNKQHELIWASPRELYNVVQAHDNGCHIITLNEEILAKLPNLGKSLEQFSLETVKMFRNDAVAAGFVI